jgi:pSer/pThr/pTyr-binding forkhead associated (FHA) protein
MRVVLELMTGSGTGQRRLLRPGQDFCVGRTEFADLACPDDNRMSREHFRLNADDVGCLITDLGSRNGTLVNGQPLNGAVLLKDGDWITAGNSTFRVRVEDDDPDAAQTRHSTRFMDAPETSAVMKGLGGRLKADFSAEQCASGLHLYSGEINEVPPAGLAELLSYNREAYVIVDTWKAGVSLSDLPVAPDPVFDFLDPAAVAASPVILAAYEFPGWTDIVRDAWGQDALVILLSKRDKDEVIPAIRQCLRPKARECNGIVGICWPSVLGAMLNYDQSGTIQPLLETFDIILLEMADLPEMWQMYSTSELLTQLQSFGLTARPAEVAPVSGSDSEFTDEGAL